MKDLLKEMEEFLESVDSLEPDVKVDCPQCDYELTLWVGDIYESFEEKKSALLEKVRSRLYR